jgi:hypothetical protein
MTAPKVLSHFGLLLKQEAAYNTYLAPSAATDGLAIIEAPAWEIDYVDHGDRGGRAPGTTGGLKKGARQGRFLRAPAIMEPAGFGAAYDGTKFPSIHMLLRAAGYSVTTDTTPGADKQTYLTESQVPPSVPFSVSGLAYDGGEEAQFHGGLVDELVLEIVNGGFSKLTANIVAAMNSLPADVALPAITYANAQVQVPAKAAGLSLTLGGVVPSKVKSCTITDTIGADPRMLDNATGNHGGFSRPADRVIKVNCVIEALAFATMNPHQIADLATSQIFSLRVGGTQYKKYKIEIDNLQHDELPQRVSEGNTRAWEFNMIAKPSSLVAYDMLRWIWD